MAFSTIFSSYSQVVAVLKGQKANMRRGCRSHPNERKHPRGKQNKKHICPDSKAALSVIHFVVITSFFILIHNIISKTVP